MRSRFPATHVAALPSFLSRNDAVIGQRTSPVVAATPSPPVFPRHRKVGHPPSLRRGGGAASTSCDEGVAATTLHDFRFPTASLRLRATSKAKKAALLLSSVAVL